MENPTVNAYVATFERSLQSGSGNFPVFAGARYYQNGSGFLDGLGNILRGAFRWFAPVAASAGASFLNNMNQARESGADWSTAAKSAIAPTASSALNKVVEKITEPKQAGSGKRRRKRQSKKQYKKGMSKRMKIDNWNF